MKQQSFTDMEYSGRARISKREQFLNIMGEIIPWEEWDALIRPYYYTGKRPLSAWGWEDVSDVPASVPVQPVR